MAERVDRRHDRAKPIEKLVTVAPGTLGAFALAHLGDLRLRNYSRHTIRHTMVRLRMFLVWCEERGITALVEVSPALLRRYQSHVFHHRKEDGHRLSFVSQHERLAEVRRFFAWMERRGHVDANPAAKLELPRVEKRLPRGILSVEEAEAVLAQPDVGSPRGLRDRAILETLYATGVRRQELAALTVDDVDLRGAVIAVREGKGKKDRLLPLSERAAAWLSKYLEEARPRLIRKHDPGRLFLGRWGQPLGEMHLGKLVRVYVSAASLGKEGSCHMFRHTMATLMLEGGADIRYVQQMLGHATITSTEIYTHVALRKLKEVHAASHPGARLSRRQRHELGEAPRDPREQLLSSLAAEAAEEEADGGGDVDDERHDIGL
jgi:integrase/recombinase XerD